MSSRENILNELRESRPEWKRRGVRQLGLFGSCARGEQTAVSDVDILIDFEQGQESFDNLMSVCDLLEALLSHYKIEVVTRNGLSPHIGPQNLKEVRYVRRQTVHS